MPDGFAIFRRRERVIPVPPPPDPEEDPFIADIVPGAGFGGATLQPDPVGDSGALAYAEKAIAVWDVVPFQTFDTTFKIGVKAKHYHLIDYVTFSVNGGDWVASDTPILNTQAGVNLTEYVARLDANDFPIDGMCEVRAIAYPVSGVPRVLASLYLFSNKNGTLTPVVKYVSHTGSDAAAGTEGAPYLTLMRGLNQCPNGGIIELMDDDPWVLPSQITGASGHRPHSYGGSNYAGVTNDRWITVRGAAALDRDDVVISLSQYGQYTPFMKRIKWQNLTFDSHTVAYFDKGAWFDNVRWANLIGGWLEELPGPPIRPQSTSVREIYITGSRAFDQVYGFTQANLVRNTELERISGDAFQEDLVVLNCTVVDLNGTVTAHHTDLFQWFGDQENLYYEDVTGTGIVRCQLFYANFLLVNTNPKLHNCYFGNVNCPNDADLPPYSQWWYKFKHVVIDNFIWHNQRVVVRTDVVAPKTFNAINCLVKNCTLHPENITLHVTPGIVGVTFTNITTDVPD